MDRNAKYAALYNKACRITEVLTKMLETQLANMNTEDDYLEQAMSSSEQEQTQDLEDEQDLYDAQESVEDEEESDQGLPDCLPASCVTLTKEHHNLLAQADREGCLEEADDYMEEAESDEEEEAQENIPPPSQLTQEEDDCCSSVHDVRETPLLTEEEIDQILNQQSSPETFYRTQAPAQPFYEFDDSVSEDSSVDQNEERLAVRPEWLTWSGPPIYDTDGESHESINNECHEIGHQQSFLSEDEEEGKEEVLEHDESKELTLEEEEAKEYAPAQEHMDLFTEPCTSEQNISELREDSTPIYDESSSSEDEGDSLSQESILLDPVEEEEILVGASPPYICSQVSFLDPYAHFLHIFQEGSKVLLSSMLQTRINFFKAAVFEQKEWELPCLSNMLKELSKKDQPWDHLMDWLHWKTMFVS